MPLIFQTAAYIRLSREDGDREESDSVSNQKKLLLNYIQKNTDLLLYNMYIDDGYSGITFQRPAFQQMLADIENKKITCVVVKDLSRFGRDYIESGRYLERYFPDKGVRFISISDRIDSLKQAYDMLLPIKNIFNEQYARDISSKVRTALRTKQQCGEFIGAFASYGYQKSPSDKNKLIIDPYAASVVRRIFSLYLQGFGKQKIAHLLNAEGVLCPSEYKRVSGLQYANPSTGQHSLWSYSTINHILHKEIYAGNMVQGIKTQPLRGKQRILEKENWIIVPGTHEAIIDKHTWLQTQKLLKSKVPSTIHTKTAEGEKGSLFSGLLFCSDCKKPMVKTSWRHANGDREYSFTCGTCKRYGKTFCTPHTIPVRVLTHAILCDLNHILTYSKNVSSLVQQQEACILNETSSRPLHQKEEERKRLEKEYICAKQMLFSSYEDYKTGILSQEEFLACRDTYRKKKNLYTNKLQALQQNFISFQEKLRQSSFLQDISEKQRGDWLNRGLLSTLISHITVYEDYRIRIHYTFPSPTIFPFPCQYSIKNKENYHKNNKK